MKPAISPSMIQLMMLMEIPFLWSLLGQAS